MQTYVPVPNSVEVAEILANAELMEVVASTLRLVEEMHTDGEHTIVAQHPLYRMWDGHAPALIGYGLTMCEELEHRGFMQPESAFEESREQLSRMLEDATSGDYTLKYPRWWGDTDLHLAHVSELLRANPNHYSKYWPGAPMTLPPIWPEA